MNKLHYESSDPGAKLAGAAFLVYCAVLVFLRLDNLDNLLRVHSKMILRGFLLLIIFGGFTVYGAANLPDSTAGNFFNILKESAFAVSMWLVALVFFVIMKQGAEYFIFRRSEWGWALAILALLMVVSGVYEIGSGMVWAGTSYSTGFSYRASGTLFNPNVLGLWCSLMITLIALFFHIGWISKLLTFLSMFVIMGSLILSSSRSGLMLSFISLGAIYIAMTLAKRRTKFNFVERFFPVAAFVSCLFLYIFCIRLITPSPYPILNTVAANILRFTQLPIDIFWIFMVKLFLPAMEKLTPSLPEAILALTRRIEVSATTHSAGKLMESVEGRTLLRYVSDNSYMALFAVGGWVPLVIWVSLWGALFWIAVKRYIDTPSILSTYALAGVVLCFSSGFFMRAPQLFPTWIFLSMVLGACLYWCYSGSDDAYSKYPKRLT